MVLTEQQQSLFNSVKEKLTGDLDNDREFIFNEAEKYSQHSEDVELYGALLEMMSGLLKDYLKKQGAIMHPDDEKQDPTWYRLDQSYTEQYIKPFTFDIAGSTITIKQKFYCSPDTIGWTVWDGSLVLSKYLEKNFQEGYFKNKRVIEIGSGCGLVGISAALLGANVVLTDMASVLEILQENVNINLPNPKGNVAVKELLWGEDVAHVQPPFDMILGADIIYQYMDPDTLIETLSALSDSNTTILLAYESHDPNTPLKFVTQASKKFAFTRLSKDELDPVYSKATITVARLQKY